MITQAELKQIANYDPETGAFTWKQRRCNAPIGSVMGCIKPDGYRYIKLMGKNYKASRLAFLYMTGDMPPLVDHRDRVRDNDKWDNLREATVSENNINRTRDTERQAGVTWCKSRSKWLATIKRNGKMKNLGRFEEYDDAVAARLKAEDE